MSNWITDRRPTINDAYRLNVWVMRDGLIDQQHIHMVEFGEPWAPMNPPEPYVKPKRCIVLLHNDGSGLWKISMKGVGVPAHSIHTYEAAERIAAIYEEVTP